MKHTFDPLPNILCYSAIDSQPYCDLENSDKLREFFARLSNSARSQIGYGSLLNPFNAADLQMQDGENHISP